MKIVRVQQAKPSRRPHCGLRLAKRLAKPPSPAALTWVMVDRVRAPAARGEYVLRWRWDAEQNPQIWTHCADVTVV